MGKIINVYNILSRKNLKVIFTSLHRPRHRWQNGSERDLKETECEVVDRIQLAQEMVQWRDLVNTVINVLVP
jgi:hypothetical protein